jgi:class 3 adenylate cyclase/tRNA A-37 threonylcarbamoyl transferase component Bud32
MSETSQLWKDRYEIERPLGRGGMGAVYLAKDRQLLCKYVVIKVLLEGAGQDEWVRHKFHQEMEALARIDHPGVVGVLDSGESPDGKQFLVMQYVEGEPLRAVMERGPVPLPQVGAIVRQIAQALAAAHEKGVWHRDLKPENIMLQRSGNDDYVKLIDFGIAGIQNSLFSGATTKVAGTLSYMAPEQFAGNPCAASDTYALAVVACEMLTGRSPFAENSMTHLVQEDLTRATPRQTRPDLPEAAERVLLKGLSFRPEARQSSVREFGEDLFTALTGGQPARRNAPARDLELAHVLFTDLVGYSLLPMDLQKQYLGELQKLVRESPRFRAAERDGEVLSLPTGDGMALVFFGDPVAPARCALEIGAALRVLPHLKLRMGIHSGPVYRVADVNANANVAGGGINIAQRVMDCGDAGHILVSKAVADVLSQLSEWTPRLCDLGEHAVKHGVKVHIFNLATADAGNAVRPAKLAPVVAAAVSKPKGKLLGVAAAVVLLAGGTAGWIATHRAPEPLVVNYKLLRDRNNIRFDVSTEQPGYLYILNYGQEAPGSPKWTINLLHPLKSASASRKGGETLRVPDGGAFEANTPDNQNRPFIVFARQPLKELEDLKLLPQDKGGLATLDDPSRVRQLMEYLDRLRAGSQAAVREVSLESR